PTLGSYTAFASSSNMTYDHASASGDLMIGKSTARITLSDLGQTYDDLPKRATATTIPAGLGGVSITYNGLATEPTNAGSYDVAALLNNANYEPATASGPLVIGKA